MPAASAESAPTQAYTAATTTKASRTTAERRKPTERTSTLLAPPAVAEISAGEATRFITTPAFA